MHKIVAIAQKEFRVSAWSFSTYLIFSIFSAATGLFFFADVIDWSVIAGYLEDPQLIQISFSQFVAIPFFMNSCLALILLIPILAARSLSEERKMGTFELLFTYPISDFQIVIGKWLALVGQVILLILPTVAYFLLLYIFKARFAPSALFVSYLGLLVIVLVPVSFTMFLSSLTSNHSIVVALSFFAAILFWMSGWVVLWVAPSLYPILKGWWVVEHIRQFAKGVFDTAYIVFYLIWTAFFLFATVVSLEARSWKR